ncbi:MAG: PBP1A family penicillin-binding protein [Clostridia bacterium]|nr:PBP1A family penicillin-binding protein [Clostridia bacterium]
MSRRRRRSGAGLPVDVPAEESLAETRPMDRSSEDPVSSDGTVSYRFPSHDEEGGTVEYDSTQRYIPEQDFPEGEEIQPSEEDPDNVWAQEDEALPIPEEDEYIDDALYQKRSIFKPRTKKPPFVVSVAVGVVRALFVVVLLAGLAVLGSVAGIAKGYVDTAPTLNLAALDEQAQTSFIYDSRNRLITEYKGTENRIMVSILAMPQYLQDAFVAVEDARFYTHSGIDLKRIIGAFVSNLSSSSTQGGSTITQQLIKNTLLSSEQSYKRKIQEAYLALQLEHTYTKTQILESYLNTIYLGENYYGVKTAAQGYFGKELGDLTLRECAMLAGATNSPYYYNPRRNFYTRQKEGVDYPAITNNRTNYVLRCMYENQFITYEQYQAALDPSTAHVLETDPTAPTGMYAYPHYVEYAIKEVISIFLELNSLEDTAANRAAMENKLRTGGYRVQLAIDTDIQNTLQSTLSSWTQYPSLRDPADKVYRSKNSDGTYNEIIEPQAAAVVLDYRTGELKAIVGSRDEPKAMKTLNRATDMKMPVGSSIKPLSVYAPALELGASPASIVFNMPLPIAGWKDAKGSDTWPRNYGGGSYTGPTTLRNAMARSYNTAAAQALMTMVGVNRSVEFLHQLGIDDSHIDATPFGVTLGSSGITPLQMTVAYGVLANGGVYQEPISVLGISDSEGKTVWDGHANQARRRVFSSPTSYMIVDMLKSVITTGTASSAKIKGQTVAGKTGTNSDQKGVFFAGMTGHYSSALWIGHDNYKALSSKSTGSGSAAPLWATYMKKIHSEKGLDDRDILEGSPSDYQLIRVTTCNVSGQLATDACRNDVNGYGVTTDYWAPGTQPTVYCQMHVNENICAESGMLASAYCPNVTVKGVVTIPYGHPLYPFIGTQYDDTLRQYLGAASTTTSTVCTLHNEFTQSIAQTAEDNSAFTADARNLIAQAQNMLSQMDSASYQYQNIQNAIAYLEAVLSTGGSQAEVINAMGLLTQAMAGF